ncbi:MAG: alpha-glucan family phosphorylase [Bacteroidales bacterium]|nr:alpha-glucan family phosphorylase [Bacteroidales bacterium]
MKKNFVPDYVFEVSWEVCNKVGGIHTVIATKTLSLVRELKNNYIVIGPDLIKDENGNPEFVEDPQLFAGWKKQAESEGLVIKIGRWNINGYPIAIILNFSNSFQNKDKIFFELWEQYKLDSLSGQWDYIEPALFGYMAGKVIESFIKFNLTTKDRIVAHFHEWMTGNGLLNLKHSLPQVGTVFTTHATVVGRCLAGNNRPLYKNLTTYDAEEIAKEFNIVSKQSLEKNSAQHADAFTTVSEITAKECSQFLQKHVDLITPNGFEDTFVPDGEKFDRKREEARKKLIEVAEIVLHQSFDITPFIVATSGRYEFKNKGIDLFIDALGRLNAAENLDRPVLAYILIPANHYGPRKDLLQGQATDNPLMTDSLYLTHNLHDAEWDPILNRIKKAGLGNTPEERVKVLFVPSYLNGNDGIFNMPYYDLLIGLDLTVFASYYEPWGYTPLESLAFSVPTVTTTLAGFGLWILKECTSAGKCIDIIDRTDDNDSEVVTKIVSSIKSKYALKPEEMNKVRKDAFTISRTVLWNTLISYYKECYDFALQQVAKRSDQFVQIEEKPSELVHEYVSPTVNAPIWKRIIVKSTLPETLSHLNEIVQNLWWTWDNETQEILESIDPEVWSKCDQNPVILFEQVSFERLDLLSKDKKYVEKINRVYRRYKDYIKENVTDKRPFIAYFSMEYGLHSSLKTYSGGLGILAGDYLKEASDHKVNIVAIGLLYRYGYFTQQITTRGEQQATYDFQHFSKLPIRPIKDENGHFKTISIVLPGRVMHARIWEVCVGRIKLYLLDTDFESNIEEDRSVTHHLYGGNNENRLKQELLLGIGGMRALEVLGLRPDLYHSNEGHSAFIGLERMRWYIHRANLTFAEAREIVRSSTLFTTHTPVPAGHDAFEEELLRRYIGHYPERLRIGWNELMALGRTTPNSWDEKFNMSHLAAHLAQEINGVSMLHGTVTQEMFARLWPGYLPEELHIGYVTNGVHYATWTAKEWKKLYTDSFGKDFENNLLQFDRWSKIDEVPDELIWQTKQQLRKKLIDAIRERFKENWIKRHEDPKQIIAINNTLSENSLTICFARRFATYKRAHLLFRNPERLAKIMSIPGKPIQFIFAGKAHPHDKAGQDLIKIVFDLSKHPEFLGKILFLQNYDMNLARIMVQGADIWLNTPTRSLEASGTSGEKAVMNGTLHFSVLDGWWVEGYHPDAGWALTNESAYDDHSLQDDLDAEIIYTMLEQEVIPAFYDRDAQNIPVEWVQMIRNSITKIAPHFTTTRMINDYGQRYYQRLYERHQMIIKDDFEIAKKISSWKKRIAKAWNNINVLEINIFNKGTEVFSVGQEYQGKVVLDLNEIPANEVGVELVVTENGERIISTHEFELNEFVVDKATYTAQIKIGQPGTFTYGLRMFPKNELLAHRQDIGFVRWIG